MTISVEQRAKPVFMTLKIDEYVIITQGRQLIITIHQFLTFPGT